MSPAYEILGSHIGVDEDSNRLGFDVLSPGYNVPKSVVPPSSGSKSQRRYQLTKRMQVLYPSNTSLTVCHAEIPCQKR